MRDIGPHPLRSIVECAIRPVCVRVRCEFLFVPALAAHIESVPKNPGVSLSVAVDRAGAPSAASRSRNAFLVQLDSNPLGRFARAIVLVNAPNHGGLLLVDRAQPADPAPALFIIARLDIVSVTQAARALTLERAVVQSAIRPLGKVLDIQLRVAAPQGHMHGRNLTFHEGDDADAAMAKPLMHDGDVGEIAAQAIDRFRQDDVEHFVLGCGEHPLEAGPHHVRAGQRLIFVFACNGPAFRRHALVQQAHLLFDAADFLVLA
ncbi:MAG TPA: hypothetical protein VGW40_07510 [Allosphingosinicella sp.]|nr:hypothetical protein [Allosphingosinicella sp.]